MKALLIVDAQNDFMPGGALAVNEGDKIVPVINSIRNKFDLIIATQDWHPTGHCSFKEQGGIWPVHCVASSFGAQLHKDLIIKDDEKIIYKGINLDIDSYSGFFDNEKKYDTGLADFLKDNKVDDLYVCGLATDYCVKFTALDAITCGFKTTLIADACRGVEINTGDIQKSINEMRDAGVNVITSVDLFVDVDNKVKVKKPDVRIMVAGQVCTGKSTIAKVICEALKSKGFDFEFVDDEPVDDDNQDARIEAIIKKHTNLLVETVQLRRSA